jgi:hypothetical protein
MITHASYLIANSTTITPRVESANTLVTIATVIIVIFTRIQCSLAV